MKTTLVRLDRTTNVKVEMPFATAETIPAEVVKINRDEASGDAVVILKCSYMNTDLAAARKEPLRIDLQSYAGVLVNEKAIHFADVTVTDTDTDGNVTEHVEQNVKGVYTSPAAACALYRYSPMRRSTAMPCAS